MPDSPDYSRELPNSSRFPLKDMGELAVRLGSGMIYDRRGELLFRENWDYGIYGWGQGLAGSGSTILLDAAETLNNPYACKMICGTGLNSATAISRRVSVIDSPRLGIELAVKLPNQFTKLTITATGYIKGKNLSLRMYLVPNGTTVDVFSDSGLTELITNLQYPQSYLFNFVNLKVVDDCENNKHVRAIIAGNEIDLTDFSRTQSFYTHDTYVDILINFDGYVGVASECSIGYINITGNEP